MRLLKPLLIACLAGLVAVAAGASAQDRDRDRTERDRERAAERAAERADRDSFREREVLDRDAAREADDMADVAERAERDVQRDADDLLDRDNSGSGSSRDDDEDDDRDNSGSGSRDDEDDDDDEVDNDRDDEDEPDTDDGATRDLSRATVDVDQRGNAFISREIVVMGDTARIGVRAQQLGLTVVERRELSRRGRSVVRLRVQEGQSVDSVLGQFREGEPEISGERNYLYRPSGAASAMDSLPSLGRTELAVSVGVIDGFAKTPLIDGSIERLSRASAFDPHGNHVINILLTSMKTVADVRPSRLLVLDVVDATTWGPAADTLALVAALDRCHADHMDIINISLAGPDHPAVRQTIAELIAAGQVVVASVGNAGPAAPPAYPAAYAGVIGVGAVDGHGAPYLYSATGAHVDFAAPGVDVPGDAGTMVTGTSFAAPVVAALAAISHPQAGAATPEALRRLAIDSGAEGRDPVFGDGILTVEAAMGFVGAEQ